MGGKDNNMKQMIRERPEKKYQMLLNEIRMAVDEAALSDAESYQYLVHNITEIMQIGFTLLNNRFEQRRADASLKQKPKKQSWCDAKTWLNSEPMHQTAGRK